MTPEEQMATLVAELDFTKVALVLVAQHESDTYDVLSRYDDVPTALLLMEAAQHVLRRQLEE